MKVNVLKEWMLGVYGKCIFGGFIMAFVNAYLTEEEKEKFREAKVLDPRWRSPKYCLEPTTWTVDEENKIALLNCGVANRDEHWKKTFALIYKQIDNEHLIELTLIEKCPDYLTEKKLREKYNVKAVTKWEVFDYKMPEMLKNKISQEELFEILENALTGYEINGKPDKKYSFKALIQDRK